MKKRIVGLTTVMLLAGCLTACQAEAVTETKVETKAETAVETKAETVADIKEEVVASDDGINYVEDTITFWHGAGDELRWEMYDIGIARFNEKYPNVKVEQTHYDNDTYKTKLKTVMGAGATDLPDLFMNWGGDSLLEYIEAGLVADITDEVADFKDEYYDFEFGLSTFDDKIYGMGLGIAPCTVYYNKDIFAELNVEIPKTWEELDAVAATMKAEGYIPFALANKQMWPGMVEFSMLSIAIAGEDLSTDLINRTGSFDNDAWLEAATKIQSFVDKGYYGEGVNGMDYAAGAARMLIYNELSPMLIQTNGFISQCLSEDPEFYEKLGTFYYPSVGENSGGVLAGGNVFSVSSQAKDPQMVADLLYYLTNQELSAEYAERGGTFTGAKGVEFTDEVVQSQFNTLMNAEWTHNYFDSQFSYEVGEAIKAHTQAIYGGTETPEEVVAGIEAVGLEVYGPVLD